MKIKASKLYKNGMSLYGVNWDKIFFNQIWFIAFLHWLDDNKTYIYIDNILSFGLAYISAEYHNNLYYMDILKLGYTKKWIDYGFLTEEILSKQIAEFEKEGTKPVEHYRYTLFVNWLKGKEALNNEEINNFIAVSYTHLTLPTICSV